jgi:hypothetical protein
VAAATVATFLVVGARDDGGYVIDRWDNANP